MLKEAIQKHYDRLSVKKKKFPNTELKYLETDEEFFNRLNGEFQAIGKHEGRDSVVLVFNSYFQKAKRDLPKSDDTELLKYALEEFKWERTTKTPYGEEALNWYNLSIVQILDKYGEFLAYEQLISNYYKKIYGNDDLASKSTKRIGRPKTHTYVFKWKDECVEELKELHKFLIDEEDPFVEKIGFKEFEENLLGKKIKKIVWIKQVGLLIYLLDNLYGLIDESLYSKKGETRILNSVFINNFSFKKGGKTFDLTKNSVHTARSRFHKGLDKEIKSDKNFKKIQTVIQQLTENF